MPGKAIAIRKKNIIAITSQTYHKTRYFRTVEIIQFNKHLLRIYNRQIAVGVTS